MANFEELKQIIKNRDREKSMKEIIPQLVKIAHLIEIELIREEVEEDVIERFF